MSYQRADSFNPMRKLTLCHPLDHRFPIFLFFSNRVRAMIATLWKHVTNGTEKVPRSQNGGKALTRTQCLFFSMRRELNNLRTGGENFTEGFLNVKGWVPLHPGNASRRIPKEVPLRVSSVEWRTSSKIHKLIGRALRAVAWYPRHTLPHCLSGDSRFRLDENTIFINEYVFADGCYST